MKIMKSVFTVIVLVSLYCDITSFYIVYFLLTVSYITWFKLIFFTSIAKQVLRTYTKPLSMFASWMIEPVLVPIMWFVKDRKSNLGAARIQTHDLRIRGQTLYH